MTPNPAPMVRPRQHEFQNLLAYVTGSEFPATAGAFADVLVEGPWQHRAFARPVTAAQ